jgi:hypothetical protein
MHSRSATFFTLAVRKYAGFRTRDTINASRLAEAFGITIRDFYDEFVARRLVAARISADACDDEKARPPSSPKRVAARLSAFPWLW